MQNQDGLPASWMTPIFLKIEHNDPTIKNNGNNEDGRRACQGMNDVFLYSERKLFTGLAAAAFNVCQLTVASANPIAEPAASR